jgi:hypothetical protein
MSDLYIIKPTTITDDILTSCTVPENDYAAYNAGTGYTLGQRCIVVATHRIYESLDSGTNTGNYPPDNTTGTTPKWLDCGATNRWRVFDSKVGVQTSQTSSMTYELTPGITDAVALMNMDATEVVMILTDPLEGVVWTKTVDLISTVGIIDFYTYCFSPFVAVTDLIESFPAYSAATLSITITKDGGVAKCGEIVVGSKYTFGAMKWSPSTGITDYSIKTTDAFGDMTILERAYKKWFTCDMRIDNSVVDEAQRQFAVYRATPVVWVGSDDYACLIVYGFYKQFKIVIPYNLFSECSLEVEGLT